MVLSIIQKATDEFVSQQPKAKRKQYGQFFTTVPTAEFMASMFQIDTNRSSIRLLDAGAGAGILSAALVSHLRASGYKGRIILICYENNPDVLPVLKRNLDLLRDDFHVEFQLIDDNYITSQPFDDNSLFDSAIEPFDLIIGNPPYKKVAIGSPEAHHMQSVCHGAPNLYFLFFAMAISNLKENGELVYIIPRSWTSGAYFERFRSFLFKHCTIQHIHLFGSRDKIFKGDSVLQETMIIKVKKTRKKPNSTVVSFSETSDFSDVSKRRIDYNVIVGANGYVYLVTTQEELSVLSRLNHLQSTLIDDGLQMKTGIIVDFRTKEVLRNKAGESTFPLFFAQHIKNGKVIWPIGKKNEYICTDRKGFLQENSNYVFIKRFTAKEEKRRLQCGIYLSKDYPQFKYISTQNKINFIKCKTEDQAFGVYTILNSCLYDTYYRILNGSTQVNSTEINKMPVPPEEVISQMGRELQGKELSVQNCNNIIDKWIN